MHPPHFPHPPPPRPQDGAREWGEYLVVYATFTHLVKTDPYFRERVTNSSILDATKTGYMLQLKYEWNRAATRSVLQALDGAHADHQQLIDGGIIKLSTSDREPIIQYFLGLEQPPSGATPSFFARCLHLVANKHAVRRDQLELVVAQYAENTNWTDGYLGARHVYTKGEPLVDEPRTHYDQYTRLPNRGRECHTYLTHVIDQYDSLAAYTGFTQGSLGDEHAWIRPEDWGPTMFANMHLEAKANRGCSNSNRMDPLGADWDWQFNLTRLITTGTAAKWKHASQRSSAQNFGQWFHHVVGMSEEPFGVMHMYPSGEFVVSKDRVRSRPRIFYEQLRNRVMDVDPIECHYLERSWYYVFNCDK